MNQKANEQTLQSALIAQSWITIALAFQQTPEPGNCQYLWPSQADVNHSLTAQC